MSGFHSPPDVPWEDQPDTKGQRIYVEKDRGHQAPFRYVRLLTLGRFELAVTWPMKP